MDKTDMTAENRAWCWRYKFLKIRAKLAKWIVGDMPFAANIEMGYVKAIGPGFFFECKIVIPERPPIAPQRSGIWMHARQSILDGRDYHANRMPTVMNVYPGWNSANSSGKILPFLPPLSKE